VINLAHDDIDRVLACEIQAQVRIRRMDDLRMSGWDPVSGTDQLPRIQIDEEVQVE
jgi:hypothetical protein